MSFWGKKPSGAQGSGVEAEPALVVTPNNATTKTPDDAPVKFAINADEASKVEASSRSDTGYGKVRSALGPGTIIQGRLSFDSVVSIDGKLSGEVFSSKALLVGKTAVVDAKIEASVVVIRGTVKGAVKATERIEIREGGQLLGDVSTPAFVMDEGCVFNGTCAMTQRASSSASKSPSQETTILAPEPLEAAENQRASSLH